MSITKPNRAEIAFTLFATRLTSRSRYLGFVESIGLKGDEKVLDFGAGWGENLVISLSGLKGTGGVTALACS